MKTLLSTFALLALPAASQAAVSTFSSKSDFLLAVQNPYTETFDTLGEQPGQPIFFTSGSYAYQASVPGNNFFNVGQPSPGDVWLSTEMSGSMMVFTFTSGNIQALGGYFFTTNVAGDPNYAGIGLRINGTDAYSLPQTDFDSFWGIVSDSPIEQLEVYPLNSTVGNWATVNDLIVAGTAGTVAAIPEPGSTLALAGVLCCGFCLRRRAAARGCRGPSMP